MRDPFQKIEDQNRMKHLLGKLEEVQEVIGEIRDWLTPKLQEPDEGSKCPCIRDSVSDLDSLLFSIDKTVFLYGSGIVTYLTTIANHDHQERVMAQATSNPEFAERLRQSVEAVAEIVTPMPVDIEGDEPDKVH